jgi:hypothetical protein
MTTIGPVLASEPKMSRAELALGLTIGPHVLLLSTEGASWLSTAVEQLLKDHGGESGSPLYIHGLTGEAAWDGPNDERIPLETRALIAAGDLFEKLIAYLAQDKAPETIFCLDPWAAQILPRGMSLASESEWIFISDLEERIAGPDSEHWKGIQEWTNDLPFERVVAVSDLGIDPGDRRSRQAVTRPPSAPIRKPLEPIDPFPPLASAPAWRWRRILPKGTSRPSTPPPTVDFILLHRASSLHLRAALDAIARQEDPSTKIQVLILSRGSTEPVGDFIQYFARAYPRLAIRTEGVASIEADSATLFQGLRMSRGLHCVALMDDGILVPSDFTKRILVGAKSQPSILRLGRVLLDAETAAHILTGNLDPIPHYEKLLMTSRERVASTRNPMVVLRGGGGKGLPEFAGRIAEWSRSEDDPSECTAVPDGVILSLPDKP